MLDFNKNQSNEKCPINNNNGGSNSKTPVSRYVIVITMGVLELLLIINLISMENP